MKKSNILPSVIKNGCVIFTIITVLSYIAGTVLAKENRAFIPTLKWVLLFLLFSLLLAAANLLLKSKKHSKALTISVHFIATAVLYFVTVVLCGGFIESGAQTLIAMALFLVLYLIFIVAYSIATGTKKKKKNKKEHYESVFK